VSLRPIRGGPRPSSVAWPSPSVRRTGLPSPAVEHLDHQLGSAFHQRDHLRDFFPGHHHGHMCLLRCANGIDFVIECLLEHLLIQKDQGVHSLVLGRRGDTRVNGQVGEKGFNLGFAPLQVFATGHSVVAHKAFDPVAVGTFGVDRIVMEPHELPDFIDETRRR